MMRWFSLLCLLLSLVLRAEVPQFLVEKGEVYLPIRYVSEWRGAQVQVDAKTQRISIKWSGEPGVAFSDGDEWCDIQDGTYSLGTGMYHGGVSGPIDREGVTFVPLLFATESLRLAVFWSAATDELFLFHPASGRVLRMTSKDSLSALPPVTPLKPGANADARQPWDTAGLIKAMDAHPPLMNVTAMNGETLLSLAARANNTEVMRYLFDHGFDANHVTKLGFTALYWAADAGSLAAVQLLVERGAKMDVTDEYWGSPLITAVRNSHSDVAKWLVEHGANPNSNCKFGTALHEAATKGDLEMARFLLDHGADINIKSTMMGRPPIYFALWNGHDAIAQLFIDRGANIFTPSDDSENTALHYAANLGRPAIVKMLLEKGAAVDAKRIDGDTPLHLASREDWARIDRFGTPRQEELLKYAEQHAAYLETVRILLDHHADVNVKSTNGTPLQTAAAAGYCDVVQLMLEHGADAKTTGSASPLFNAVNAGNSSMVRMLVKAGAAVNTQGYGGTTPLHAAAGQGDSALVYTLLQLGANPSAIDEFGETPLHDAFDIGADATVVSALLEYGAQVDALDNDDQTPLLDIVSYRGGSALPHGSAEAELARQPDAKKRQQSRITAVLELIANGANVNALDRTKQTPLHKVAIAGFSEVAKLLITHLAVVDAPDKEGMTPLHLAARYCNPKTVAVLLAAKADVNARDNSGHTPLQYASEEEFDEVVKLLVAAGAK